MSNPMGLETLLSVPLNRISQYHFAIDVSMLQSLIASGLTYSSFLYQAIFKLTPRNDPDYKNLTELLQSLGELQVHFNSFVVYFLDFR